MKRTGIRLLSVLLAVAMLPAYYVPMEAQPVSAVAASAHYTSYNTIAVIPNKDSCPSMQGCDVDTTYMYCSKINTTTETSANLVRVNVTTGEYVDNNYQNYGIDLSKHGISLAEHGIDSTVSHVYRLTNRVDADGSNMVYLYVDNVEIGALNNYYLGPNSQGTTTDWLNGKDLSFRYVGNQQYPITNSQLGCLQVWENGIPTQDTADSFRWEPKSNKLTSITTNGFDQNLVTALCTPAAFIPMPLATLTAPASCLTPWASTVATR